MPELPEVETVRRQLEGVIVGEEVAKVEVRAGISIIGNGEEIVGKRVESVGRVAKQLIVRLSDRAGMVVHLKMTGRLVLDEGYAKSPYTRVVFVFKSGKAMYFWDTRKFGWVKIIKNLSEEESRLKKALGPEPWEIEGEELWQKLQRTKRAMKTVLLDQAVLSGVGNIYANDGLFLAGVDPRRPANSLSMDEADKVLKALQKVMERGLELGGASDNTYRDAYGRMGKYQEHFLVYGRTGEKCKRRGCIGKVIRVTVGGRGTFFCPECQK